MFFLQDLILHDIFCQIYVVANSFVVVQVFPLLIEKYSFEEQADLVWEFLCSIPVDMMTKFLPWLSSSVSPEEHQDMINCLRKIVPNEKLLKQVIFFFIQDSFSLEIEINLTSIVICL